MLPQDRTKRKRWKVRGIYREIPNSVGDLEVNSEETITEIIQENIPELMIIMFELERAPECSAA